tara:strand:- start:76 stop:186 length:111 start_codon:yes stop_codon:yes gene_type:complete
MEDYVLLGLAGVLMFAAGMMWGFYVADKTAHMRRRR